jgi:DNA-binding XRE family transcriptional regulator
MGYRRWADIKKDYLTPERIAKVRKEVEVLSHEIRLRQLREMLQKTQTELAVVLGKTQESLSKAENRADCLLSTIIAYVRALGGQLRIFAEVDGTLYPLHLGHLDESSRQGNSTLRAAGRRLARGSTRARPGNHSSKSQHEFDKAAPRKRAA